MDFEIFAENLQSAKTMRKLVLETVYSDYHFTLGSIDLWAEYQGTLREEDPDVGVSQLFMVIVFHPYRDTN